MKILIVSDLHFEFHKDRGHSLLQSLVPADVLVVAGDLHPQPDGGLHTALDLCCRYFPKVIFVAGNHEFYGSSFEDVYAELSYLRAVYDNLYVLDNSVEEINGIRFVGTTMWIRKTPHIEMYHGNISDFRLIMDASTEIYEENRKALLFLEQEVRPGDVVVTHHLPSEESIHWRYKGSILNRFFLCDMENLIAVRKPKLWIHGHTHESCDYKLGETRIICNPFGYVGGDQNKNFKTDLVVEL